ncbi:hypothetical protein [Streptomyces sp. NPDC049813]|uniref:hypothetical protein n=1 Tax=Streptomyces sp. NPDC049813 TaxID=3365597 RepID=UPI0037A5CAD9
MKRVIAAASTVLAIFGGVAACGSSASNDTSGDTVSVDSQKETPAEPKEDSSAEPRTDSSAESRKESSAEPKKEKPAETQRETPAQTKQETPSATGEETPSASEPQEQETSSQPESQPAADSAPTLKVGKTVHVETTEYSDDGSTLTGTADVTLVSVKEYDAADLSSDSVSSELEAGQEIASVTLKVKNTSGTEISMTPYNSSLTWTGKDGKVAEVMTGYLDELSSAEDLGGTDSLKPGEYVQGATVVVIPGNQPGKLHIEDDGGKHLFDVGTQGVA